MKSNKPCLGTTYFVDGKSWCVGEKTSKKSGKSKKRKTLTRRKKNGGCRNNKTRRSNR